MAQSKAHIRATTRTEKKIYDKLLIRIRKDSDLTRDMIAKVAEGEGMSLNAYFLQAVREKIERDS